MIKIKWGIISGIIALVFSLILGIISGVQPSFIFLRALIFTVVFFGFGIGLGFLVDNFFPELLLRDEGPAYDGEQPGSRVNITLENTGEYAVPEMYKSSGGTQDLGNIEELISGAYKPRSRRDSAAGPEGIDRKREDVYNGDEGKFKQNGFDMEASSSDASHGKPVFTPMFGDDSAGLGGLPDLDSMATAFSSGGESASFKSGGDAGGEPDSLLMQSFDDMEPMPSKSKKKGDNPAIQGDFSPQEIAQGIRTVLDRDK